MLYVPGEVRRKGGRVRSGVSATDASTDSNVACNALDSTATVIWSYMAIHVVLRKEAGRILNSLLWNLEIDEMSSIS